MKRGLRPSVDLATYQLASIVQVYFFHEQGALRVQRCRRHTQLPWCSTQSLHQFCTRQVHSAPELVGHLLLSVACSLLLLRAYTRGRDPRNCQHSHSRRLSSACVCAPKLQTSAGAGRGRDPRNCHRFGDRHEVFALSEAPMGSGSEIIGGFASRVRSGGTSVSVSVPRACSFC